MDDEGVGEEDDSINTISNDDDDDSIHSFLLHLNLLGGG